MKSNKNVHLCSHIELGSDDYLCCIFTEPELKTVADCKVDDTGTSYTVRVKQFSW